MTKVIEQELAKEFGETIVKRCAFCDKTYEISKFYSIPNEKGAYSLMNSAISAISTPMKGRWGIGAYKPEKESKNINEGICFKCILNGLLRICNNDREKINKYLALYFKEKIVDALDNKKD